MIFCKNLYKTRNFFQIKHFPFSLTKIVLFILSTTFWNKYLRENIPAFNFSMFIYFTFHNFLYAIKTFIFLPFVTLNIKGKWLMLWKPFEQAVGKAKHKKKVKAMYVCVGLWQWIHLKRQTDRKCYTFMEKPNKTKYTTWIRDDGIITMTKILNENAKFSA